MQADATIERILRVVLRDNQARYYQPGTGLDEVGLIEAACRTVEETHGEIVRQSIHRMLRQTAQRLLREIDHGSRASATVPRDAQQGLPGFAEIEDEYYTDADNTRWLLLDMSQDRLLNVINYYRNQETFYQRRADRLARIAVRMRELDLDMNATVRDLYERLG